MVIPYIVMSIALNAQTTCNLPAFVKASVLCGLSPTVIMECAGRALNFWAYQTTSEMFVIAGIDEVNLLLMIPVPTKHTWRRV